MSDPTKPFNVNEFLAEPMFTLHPVTQEVLVIEQENVAARFFALLRHLSATRITLNDIDEMYAEEKKAWEASYKQLIDARAAMKRSVEFLEDCVRMLGIQLYQQTGNKPLAPGTQVKLFSEWEYDNEVAAKWARKMAVDLPSVVKPDFKAIEKVLALMEVDWATEKVVPKVVIASNIDIDEIGELLINALGVAQVDQGEYIGNGQMAGSEERTNVLGSDSDRPETPGNTPSASE